MTVRELTDVLLDSTHVRFLNEREELLFDGPLYEVARDECIYLDKKEILYIEARLDDCYYYPYLAVVLDMREKENV